jgi:hypothetical protein
VILKIVTLFLIGIAVLAVFGRLRFPSLPRRRDRANRLNRPRTCPKCGSFIVGSGGCACEDPGNDGSGKT